MYSLIGIEPFSFGDVSKILSLGSGKEILYVDTTPADFIEKIMATGVTRSQAEFWAEWIQAMKMGDMQGDGSNTLEVLLGRKPATLESFLNEVYFSDKDSK